MHTTQLSLNKVPNGTNINRAVGKARFDYDIVREDIHAHNLHHSRSIVFGVFGANSNAQPYRRAFCFRIPGSVAWMLLC